jgi:hypothetical protein
LSDNEDLKIFLEDFCDFLDSLEASIVKMKRQISKLVGSEPEAKANSSEKLEWNPEGIKWRKAEGFRGEYERYPLEGEKAEASPDYKNLLEDLKKHGGRLTKNGYFYWMFEDSATIGRKKRKREAKG